MRRQYFCDKIGEQLHAQRSQATKSMQRLYRNRCKRIVRKYFDDVEVPWSFMASGEHEEWQEEAA